MNLPAVSPKPAGLLATPQQLAVWEAVSGQESHVLSEAVAGSGKSTTALGAAKSAKGHVGFVAFNRHIAEHLQTKLGGRARACTLHSLGFSAVRKHCPGVSVDTNKPKDLLRLVRPAWFYQDRFQRWKPDENARAVLELSRLAKLTLAADLPALADVVEHYGVEMPDRPKTLESEIAPAVLELLECSKKNTDRIDYDDMVWLPVAERWRPEGFSLLIVDEVQDLSRVMQELAFLSAGSGRLLCVGDRRQSIMGFSGADTESIPRLRERMGLSPRSCLDRPLTVTFRCPVSHVELARQIVPEIEPKDGAEEGIVRHIGGDSGEVLKVVEGCGPEKPPLVICRRNAPLLGQAYRLFSAGKPVLLRGRDVGKGLTDLLDKLNAADPKDLVAKLARYEEREKERLARKDAPESAFEQLADRVESLSAVATRFDTLAELRQWVAGLFSDETPEGKTILSSVHRAKGLEAETVVILEPQKMPMVFRCKSCGGKPGLAGCKKCGGTGVKSKPWEIEQEYNLLYVAVTRSKRELIFAGNTPAVLLKGDRHGLAF
jgi:DNA helicase-2/ATP-dependent DNA helicase PcrA